MKEEKHEIIKEEKDKKDEVIRGVYLESNGGYFWFIENKSGMCFEKKVAIRKAGF